MENLEKMAKDCKNSWNSTKFESYSNLGDLWKFTKIEKLSKNGELIFENYYLSRAIFLYYYLNQKISKQRK